MAFRGGRRSGNKGGGLVRLTRLFPTKKQDLRVGSTTPEGASELLKLCEKCADNENGVAFFLYQNVDDDGRKVFQLYAAESQRQENPRKRRSSRDDDDDPDDRPRRKRRDDDDDDPPRKKRASREEEDDDNGDESEDDDSGLDD